jgi:hypothetical protein
MRRAIALMTFAIVFVLGIGPYAPVSTRYWATGLTPLNAAPVDDDDTRQCSNATLKGSFGYTATGNIVSGPFAGPIAFVGRETFDGLGLESFTQTVSRNGVIFPNVTGVLPYTVNADCTGSLGTLYLVVDDNGKEVRTIIQNAGVVITVTGRKISTRD